MLNRESYEKNRSHLPEYFTEKILEGGCHGQFGSYGVQKGDGTPTITQQEQVEETRIADYVWLPLRFVEPCEEYPNGMVFVDWKDEWRIEDYE